MPNDNAIKFGILKCRDLVEIYYGARMVVQVIESSPPDASGGPIELLKPDPRRIRYEIIAANQTNAAGGFSLGTQATFGAGNQAVYAMAANETIIIERDWLTDLEGVTIGQFIQTSVATVAISTRETFLTPIPVDEMP